MDDYVRLQRQLTRLTAELFEVRCSALAGGAAWRPAVNAYRCSDRFVICLELAGVNQEAVAVHAEPRRVIIRGVRPPPDPAACANQPTQVLAMEIDHGPFEREIRLPLEIIPGQATAEQHGGWLWIQLPLQTHA